MAKKIITGKEIASTAKQIASYPVTSVKKRNAFGSQVINTRTSNRKGAMVNEQVKPYSKSGDSYKSTTMHPPLKQTDTSGGGWEKYDSSKRSEKLSKNRVATKLLSTNKGKK